MDPKFSCIGIKEDVQRRLGLLNHGAVLTRTSEAGLPRGTWRFVRLNRHFAKYFSGVDDGETFRLGSLAKQSPNYDNRVSLGTETDYTGMRRIKLDFRTNDIDRESIGRSLRFLVSELGRLALGRVRLDFEDTSDLPFELGEHHMGTTRMHRDLKLGVVNEHCRVHGIHNLHVTGGSVFPSGGFSNPTLTTLTMVAISLRLADHLKGLS